MDALPLSPAPRPLGVTDLRASPLAYGCWRFAGTDLHAARAKVEAALESGITLFDHADIYGGDGAAEALFGRVLADAPPLRAQMLIATKCGIVPGVPYDSSPAHIAAAAEASLRRLRIDVIDLYQIHRPDLLGHPAEIAAAFARLRSAGKIREVGVSNYTVDQFDALQRHLPFPIATHQPQLSAWCLQAFRDGVIDQCQRAGATPLAWSPLAGGLLGRSPAAARREPDGERLAALLACLDRLAEREQVSRAALALAFILVHPVGAIAIIGTQQPERIRAGADAFRVRLTRRDWYEIFQTAEGRALP